MAPTYGPGPPKAPGREGGPALRGGVRGRSRLSPPPGPPPGSAGRRPPRAAAAAHRERRRARSAGVAAAGGAAACPGTGGTPPRGARGSQLGGACSLGRTGSPGERGVQAEPRVSLLARGLAGRAHGARDRGGLLPGLPRVRGPRPAPRPGLLCAAACAPSAGRAHGRMRPRCWQCRVSGRRRLLVVQARRAGRSCA